MPRDTLRLDLHKWCLRRMAHNMEDHSMSKYRDADYFNELGLVNDPYPYFDYLRSLGPAVKLPMHNVIAVTGYD
jgi:hypothetical protein